MGEGAGVKAKELIIVVPRLSLPTSQGHHKVPMRFMLTPRKVQRHRRRHRSSHVLEPFLQVGACRPGTSSLERCPCMNFKETGLGGRFSPA